jgi:hypothetical protein
MEKENQMLWRKIAGFELDDAASTLTFTDRLSRENGWTYEFSVRAILEYKKFIFLNCIFSQPLTPSDEVDQVWRLHLIYTHSYWDEFCDKILNRKIHHGPAKGGNSESAKFMDWYARTLELYKISFTKKPPSDIWPSPQQRFRKNNFQRVDRDRYWMIKKIFR